MNKKREIYNKFTDLVEYIYKHNDVLDDKMKRMTKAVDELELAIRYTE